MAMKSGKSMVPTVSEKRFRRIVESYGANPLRWPEDERQGALRFAEEQDKAAIYIAEPAALDRTLNDMPMPAPADEALIAQIIAAANRADGAASASPLQPVTRKRRQQIRWLMPRLIGLAVACGLGLVLGFLQLGTKQVGPASIDANILIYGASGVEDDLKEIN